MPASLYLSSCTRYTSARSCFLNAVLKFPLLTALLLLGAAPIRAQIIFSEDFDGIPGPTAGGAGTYVFPSGWTLANVDNRTPDAQTAYVNEAWERREDFNFNVLDSCAFSTSYTSPTGIANDWMWTPAINLSVANPELSWNAVTYDPLYRDGYEVRIMTVAPTGTTGNIGNMLTNSTLLLSIAAENTNWTNRKLDLTTYAGQTVYIGFRNNSNDKFLLLIDDVKVEQTVFHDAQALQADTFFYHQIPFSQLYASGMHLQGKVRNNGLNALTNVNMGIDVYDSANGLAATGIGNVVPSLAPGATASFDASYFLPVGPDTYTFKYFPITTETDQVQSNDTFYRSQIISDTVYARGNGIVNGALGIGAGNGGYLGQSYTFIEPAYVSSATVYYTIGYPADHYGLALWNTNPDGSPNQIIATTDTLSYPNDSSLLTTLSFIGGPVSLAAGKYVITAIEFDSTLSLAQVNSNFEPNATWVDWPTNPASGWGNNEDYGPSFAKSYYLNLNIYSEPPVNYVFYRDADGDLYGNVDSTILAAVQPVGYVTDSTDCNDANALVNPGQTEICGNGIDDNCDGVIDEGCYCSSSGSGAAGNKFIKLVKLQTAVGTSVLINNVTANDNGYGNYSAIQGNVNAGTAYKMTLNPSLLPANNPMFRWKVWIDYNKDGDFDDAGENVASVSANGNVSTPNFTIPATAVKGQALRMRVSMKMGSAFATACETGFNGEVEDYTIYINGTPPSLISQNGLQGQAIEPALSLAEAANSFSLYPNPAKGEFFIKLEMPVQSAQAECMVTDLSGKLVHQQHIPAGTSDAIRYEGPALSPGTYMVELRGADRRSIPQKLVILE